MFLTFTPAGIEFAYRRGIFPMYHDEINENVLLDLTMGISRLHTRHHALDPGPRRPGVGAHG